MSRNPDSIDIPSCSDTKAADPETDLDSPSEHTHDAVSNTQPCNPSSGSIFSSPKLVAGSNPFAVRSPSGGRMSGDSNGDTNHASVPSCIIAPSKFGAPAVAAATPASPSHKENRESSECNGSSKTLLRPSLIGSPSNSILKPATLGSSTGRSSSTTTPMNSNNPFSRPVDVDDETPEPSLDGGRRSSTEASTTKHVVLLPSRLVVPEADEGSVSEGSNISATVPVVPASSITTTGNLFSASASTAPPTVSSGNNFVFGQKLHERVANPNHAPAEPKANGIPVTENLFDITPKEKSEAESASSNGLPAPSMTLSDSARVLEEARAAKRKYDEVTVVTGEEDEQNALQVYGKLFTFDKAQGNWVERGRGTLRLNDKQLENQTLQSRLVMRTQGCLRVILNTKVWAEMTIDKTSSKSIRLTAVDNDQIRVFLLMASLKDTETLFNALEWRLATLRAQQSRAAAAVTSSELEQSSFPSNIPAEKEDIPEDNTSPKRSSSGPEETLDEAKKKRSE